MKRFLVDRSAATAIEYALIGGLVSIALIGGVTMAMNSVSNTWNTVSNTVDNQLIK